MRILPYLIVSVVLLFIAVLLALFRPKRQRMSGTSLTLITVLVFLSVISIRYPLLVEVGERPVMAVLHSTVRAVNTITKSEDMNATINDGVRYIIQLSDASQPLKTEDNIAHAYAFYVIVQCLVAPLLCGFVLFKAINPALSKLQLKVCRRPVFFFTRLTEDSIFLARSIMESMAESGKSALLCFTHTGGEMSSATDAMWQELRRQGAILIRESLSRRRFPRFAPSINCILCDQNEQMNLHELINLLEPENDFERRYQRRCSVKYFIFAQSRQAEQVIDALSREHVARGEKINNRIICMLNPKENLAVHILDETPLHRFASVGEDGKRRLNVLIAGDTPLAESFLRNAYACGQMHDCRLSITMASPGAEAFRERLMISAPMLRKQDAAAICGNSSIRFVTLRHPEAVADEELLREADYILVAYQADEVNIRSARSIRTIVERQKLTDARRAEQNVAIVYAVEDIALHRMCQRIDTPADRGVYQPCTMIPAGSRDRQYHTDVLFGHKLLRRAFFLDRAYGKEMAPQLDEKGVRKLQESFIAFMNRAYQRRSSVAAALHLSYRADFQQQMADDPRAAELILADVEHRRWSAYMIMAGYVPPTQEQLQSYFYQGRATQKNEALRLHPCIVKSGMAHPDDLWDLSCPAEDPLDGVSRKLHALAVKRLAEVMERHGLNCPAVEELKRSNLPSLQKKVAGITDPADKQLADALLLALFKDYREQDLNIVSKTMHVLELAGSPEILAALRLFWLEDN